MDEAQGKIEFREIDEHGNPLEHHLETPEAARRASPNPFIIGLWVLESALVISIMTIINEAMTPFTPSPGNTMQFALILMNMTPHFLQAAALILATRSSGTPGNGRKGRGGGRRRLRDGGEWPRGHWAGYAVREMGVIASCSSQSFVPETVTA